MNARAHPLAVDMTAELQRRELFAEPRTLEQAQAEFDEFNGKRSVLTTELQDLEFAFSAAKVGGPHEAASEELKARFARFKSFVETRPRRARERIEAIQEELDDLQPKLEVARERLRRAREAAAAAVAATFRPRQQKAVQAIAAALEQLSRAVAAEIELHVEFQAAMPDFDLIDFGRAWHHALLNNPRTQASEWARQAQAAGFLK